MSLEKLKEQLLKLDESREATINAINSKGGNLSEDAKVSDLAGAIDELNTVGDLGEIEAMLELKADKSDTYTKSEVDALVAEGGGCSCENIINITWQELKDLRDNGELVAGTQYRITDYHTYIDADGCRSEHYPFDIIVTADSENALNESARAINHPKKLRRKIIYVEDNKHNTFFYERYEYDDSENLFAWCRFGYENVTPEMAPIDWDDIIDRVQVSIDIEKLSIGDEFTIEGKNVTLLSIFDEVDHFKNCNLAAWELKYCLDNDTERFAWAHEIGKGVIYYMKDEWGNECPYDFKSITFYVGFDKAGHVTTKDSEVVSHDYVYTFACKVNNNSYDHVDASIFCNNGTLSGQVVGNAMAPHYINGNQQALNGNVFYNKEQLYACNNTFEEYCTKNILGNECHRNTFGESCSRNNIGNDSCNNEFKGDNYDIIINYCSMCSFGMSCTDISMNGVCENNVFNCYCHDISIQNECYHNIFGAGCDNSVIGVDCCNNIIGDDCTITMGDGCHNNIIGNNCNVELEGHFMYINVLANTRGEIINNSVLEQNAVYPQVFGLNENGDIIAKPMLSGQTENSPSFNDVTLIGVGLQTMFVRAPKGLLKETDKPVFARYRKSKIRGSDGDNYWVGYNTQHETVKGWIVPLTHPMPGEKGVHEWAEDMSLQKISPNDIDAGCSSWDDKYDFFQVLYDGEDFISWMSWARYNENITSRNSNEPLKLVAQKLGIRIDRDGKTIVDYLPFSTQERNEELVYGRWR